MMENKFLAFIDVLGFRKGVTSHKSKDYVERYLSAVEKIIDPKVESLSMQLEYVVFSDSILISSKSTINETYLSADVVEGDRLRAIVYCCSRLFYLLTIQGIPVRGSISYGLLERTSIGSNGGNIFIAGPALVEAYDIERRQNWVGITLCPSVYEKMNAVLNMWTMKDFIKGDINFFKWKDIPLNAENGSEDKIEGFVIFPRSVDKTEKNQIGAFIKALDILRMSNFEASIRIKYQNTIDVFNKIEKALKNEREKEREKEEERRLNPPNQVANIKSSTDFL